MTPSSISVAAAYACCACTLGYAQLIDRTKAPNAANEGISKSLEQQIGGGRGDIMTPDSSAFNINRDPFRAIRRGRQIFQRKFQRLDGAITSSFDNLSFPSASAASVPEPSYLLLLCAGLAVLYAWPRPH